MFLIPGYATMRNSKTVPPGQVDRREFLRISTGAIGAVLFAEPTRAVELGQEFPTHRFRVRRDADLLSLEFSFVNFERRRDMLLSLGAARSLVIVRLPPQNIAEARFDKAAREAEHKPGDEGAAEPEEQPLLEPIPPTSQNSHTPPVPAMISGPSWVVFVAPDGVEFPLNLAAARRCVGRCDSIPLWSRSVVDIWLHRMGDWKIRTPRNAVTPGTPGMPAPDETCLEIPFRLYIAPRTDTTKWITSSSPPMRFEGPKPGAVELWHAALHDRKKLWPADPPKDMTNLPPELAPPKEVTWQGLAVFSPDYRPGHTPAPDEFFPGKMPLSHRSRVRHRLVEQMARKDGGWIDAEHLVLSSLGASASLSYTMQKTFRELHDAQLNDPNSPASYDTLAIWKHRMVVGRDTFLLSAWVGFLFPFVIPALFVELTKRRFASYKKNAGISPPGAYLITEYFILVQDPVKQFSGADNVLGAKNPVKKVTMLETRSPLIINPTMTNPPTIDAFKPQRLDGGGFVRWSVEFEDAAGIKSRTTDAFMVFASNLRDGHELWNNNDAKTEMPLLRQWSMPAQKMAMAPDQAQLIIPGQNGAANQSHALLPGERAPARDLASAAHDFISQAGNAASDIEERALAIRDFLLGTSLGSGNISDPVKQAFSRLEGKTRGFLAQLFEPLRKEFTRRANEAIAKANQAVSDASPGQASENAQRQLTYAREQLKRVEQDVVEEVLRQLARAERAATDVECHAIEFASRRVKELLERAKKELPDLLDTVQNAEQYFTRLHEKIKGEKEFESTQRELNAVWDGLPDDWNTRKARAKEYFDRLKAEADAAKTYLRNGFQPQMTAAHIIVPALKAMGGATPPQEFKLLEAYAAKGIDQVQNSVFGHFTQVIDDGKAMAQRVQAAVAAPAAQIAGLSRDLGALAGTGPSDIEKLAKQATEFDLQKAIPDFKILGVLPLSKLISAVLGSADLPTIHLTTLPDHIEQLWEWNAPLDKADLGIVTFIPNPTGNTPNPPEKRDERVHLYVSMKTRIDVPRVDQAAAGTPPKGRVTLEGIITYWNRAAKKPIILGDLANQYAFSIVMLGLIDIKFIDVSFSSEYDVGQSPSIKFKPRLGAVDFLPPLDFVKKLQDALPFLGRGFKITQDAGRIGLSYEFKIPGVGFGVFSFRNLAIGSGVLFSLEGKPVAFSFNISSFREPFEVSVLCFGGRGFLRIAVDTAHLRELEGMIEFGGVLSFDVVVASGSLYVMAGIYFRITNGSTTIAAFFRAGGNVNVLGLITASVEFMLMLGYVKEGGQTKLAGEATLTIGIGLFLVSYDVRVSMHKEFIGSGEPSEGGQARMDRLPRSTPFRLASDIRASPSRLAAPQPPIRPAYFRRAAAGATTIPGRFESASEWYADYWSQFAL
jgi:hypothetical protein